MKFLLTTLSSGLLLAACHTNCMQSQKNGRKPSSARPPRNAAVIKAANTPLKSEPVTTDLTSIPKGTSVPELAKLIQEVTLLRKQNSISAVQLDGLLELAMEQKEIAKKQEELLKVQGQQIALLLAITQTTCGSLFSSNTQAKLQSATAGQHELPSFVPTQYREWEGTLGGRMGESLFESPNHPRKMGSDTGTNPWESPNHPRK